MNPLEKMTGKVLEFDLLLARSRWCMLNFPLGITGLIWISLPTSDQTLSWGSESTVRNSLDHAISETVSHDSETKSKNLYH